MIAALPRWKFGMIVVLASMTLACAQPERSSCAVADPAALVLPFGGPVSEQMLKARGQLLQGDAEAALRTLDIVVVSGPGQIAARHVLRGLAFEALPSTAEAFDAYDAALAATPDHPAVLVRIAALSFRMGDRQRARQLASRVADRSPGNAEAQLYIYLLEDDPARASAALQQLLLADGPDGY